MQYNLNFFLKKNKNQNKGFPGQNILNKKNQK